MQVEYIINITEQPWCRLMTTSAAKTHDDIRKINFVYFYRPQRSCGQGNIFTPVCHSVHSGGGRGGYASVHAGIPPPRTRQTPPDQADPPRDQADTPQTRQTPPGPGRHPPGPGRHPRTRQTPPNQADHPQTRQTPPGTRQTPPREADTSIQSMSSQYASYWNAFLLYI